jgi:hypothetical protein
MKTTSCVFLSLLCALSTVPLAATHRSVGVVVSPSVLVQKSSGPPSITVHAHVPWAEVDLDSVSLVLTAVDGSTARVWPVRVFADDCADLVSKFSSPEVRAFLTATQRATFTLEAWRWDGSLFSGSCVVTVK